MLVNLNGSWVDLNGSWVDPSRVVSIACFNDFRIHGAAYVVIQASEGKSIELRAKSIEDARVLVDAFAFIVNKACEENLC